MVEPQDCTYTTRWSPEDGQFVGLCTEYPSLSWLADTPAAAVSGIALLVVGEALADAETPAVTIRAQVLRDAESLVCGDRDQQCGHPRDNLKRTAEYWNDYLYPIMQSGDLLAPRDVALMMILVEIARAANGHKLDTLVGIAGYAAIAAEVA